MLTWNSLSPFGAGCDYFVDSVFIRQVLLPSNHWNSVIFMGLFISLAITTDRTTKNNIFVVLLVASVTNVVYLLSFSQMSSWITNGHQRPTKILLVHSSGRQKGPVCSSRFYLPGTVPPLQGAIYTTTYKLYFQEAKGKLPPLFRTCLNTYLLG